MKSIGDKIGIKCVKYIELCVMYMTSEYTIPSITQAQYCHCVLHKL